MHWYLTETVVCLEEQRLYSRDTSAAPWSRYIKLVSASIVQCTSQHVSPQMVRTDTYSAGKCSRRRVQLRPSGYRHSPRHETGQSQDRPDGDRSNSTMDIREWVDHDVVGKVTKADDNSTVEPQTETELPSSRYQQSLSGRWHVRIAPPMMTGSVIYLWPKISVSFDWAGSRCLLASPTGSVWTWTTSGCDTKVLDTIDANVTSAQQRCSSDTCYQLQTDRGGFRHVPHVQPNSSPHKKTSKFFGTSQHAGNS